MEITWKDGYFYKPDGTRYFPMGQFGCYFRAEYVNEELGAKSQHGGNLLEFQRCTKGIWRKLFQFFKEEGYTCIRMFPRGESGGSAWEGLDIGGKVNMPLFENIKKYMSVAREFDIKLQLCLFTEPECSFYCRDNTRTYWGRRLWKPEEIENASPSQRRFLDNPTDIVPYNQFFSDPDVRVCCHQFLDEILPLLKDFEDLFCIEVFNEMGWASPHENPANTFRWEITDDYLDWSRDMVDHIRRVAPELPLCISDAGVGILGHDTVQWGREIAPDFFSLHNYPDICGAQPGTDYAAVTDMTLQYTQSQLPSIMGEWQAQFSFPVDERETRILSLLSRDMAWLTMLSGAPGCVSWGARGYAQYQAVRDVFNALNDYTLIPDTPLVINVAEAQQWFEQQVVEGLDTCVFPEHKWCPDRSATDGKHRFCVKAESQYHRHMLEIEQWSLEKGIPFRFSLTEGRPLMQVTEADFDALTPVLDPIKGYQQKVLSTDKGALRIVFLRNYVIEPFMANSVDGLPVERFSLRTQKAVPVVLSGLDQNARVKLYDLETRVMTEIDPKQPLGLGVTDHDFVLVIEK